MKRKLNLYHKFALGMIILGLVPVLILTTLILGVMMREYQNSLEENYKQAALHINSNVENMLGIYDSASQLIYHYNVSKETQLSNYDGLRQILSGEFNQSAVQKDNPKEAVVQFLKAVESVDNYIYATHFLMDCDEMGKQSFHYSQRATFFKNESVFFNVVDFNTWDKTSKKLFLIPIHGTDYFNGVENNVFTVARNYYDLRGAVGQEKYIGTIFIDVDVEKLRIMLKGLQIDDNAELYLVDDNDVCFFSNRQGYVGKDLEEEGLLPRTSENKLVLSTGKNKYGLKVVLAVDTHSAYKRINLLHNSMYLALIICAVALIVGSFLFSNRLTSPIHRMMLSMEQIEKGNFDIELPVESRDEIGVLSARFNIMSQELKNYINQSYIAQIKKNEAELTALRSQIYPHFLYNTLEIIRMTALENNDIQVSKMIEALSEQIHYLIGQVSDRVPLEKELDIVRKYVYLLNCRIEGKVLLNINAPGSTKVMVPRLILQPIVENAYVHGIKPRKGRGSILIEAITKEDKVEISVMDNGVGMDEQGLEKIEKLLKGNEPGIKNEYNWQSIGLKNVHDRIRFLYGEDYGLQITSSVAVGTIVQIILPLQETSPDDFKDGGIVC